MISKQTSLCKHGLAFLVIASLMVLTGCSSHRQQGGTGSLSLLEQIEPNQSLTGDGRTARPAMNQIRYDALKNTALSLGARAGLAQRSKELNTQFAEHERELTTTYNFHRLMLPDNVLPPVLQTARNTLNLANPDVIRLASERYKIIQQARFVTAPPTWRDYLWMNYPEPDVPHSTLLPHKRVERLVWKHYVKEGWKSGIAQGNAIFAADLARLNRDYRGMILYRELYERNMVSAPFVARTRLGVTGDTAHMSVNDQILRITAKPELNLDSQTWRPIIVPDPMARIKALILAEKSPKLYSKSSIHALSHLLN